MMTRAEFEKALRAQVAHVRAEKLWDKAHDVAKTLGSLRRTVHDWSTEEVWEFSAKIQGVCLRVRRASIGQFHHLQGVSVQVDGKVVFRARELDYISHSLTLTEELLLIGDKRLKLRGVENGHFVVLDIYRTGPWIHWLDPTFLRGEAAYSDQETCDAAAIAAEEARLARPLDDYELNVARNIGVL